MTVDRSRAHAARVLLSAALLAALTVGARAAEVGGALPPLFPANNWWNVDISAAPVDSGSAGYLSFIGTTRTLHPDFGGTDGSAWGIYGFPYVTVSGSEPKKAVQFDYSDESDGVDHTTDTSYAFYPIPDAAKTQPHWIEGGAPGNQPPDGDRHMLIVDTDNKRLYELYSLYWDGARWTAGSGAFFDLTKNDRRPEGWTSADAAGLAMLPGLVRYDEVFGTSEINHAFRITVRDTNGHVYPASHTAGSAAGAPPMGARLRLKASKDISSYPAAVQKIFRAMKKYGLIVADNSGSSSYVFVSGTFDTRWDNDVLNPAFHSLRASDFEVVQLGYQPVARPQPVWHSWFAVNTLETPMVGDFNGDGRTDIITFTRQNPSAVGDVYVALSDGTKFGSNTKWHDWFAISTAETVVIGDYDGDGDDDIATWLGQTTRQVYVALSNGTGMAHETVWESSIGSDPTDVLLSGDVNGDHRADLVCFARRQGKVYVALSTGSGFGTPKEWHGFFAVSTYERPRVADVNGDGRADIVTFATDSPTAQGDVYVAISDGTKFTSAAGVPNNSTKWHDWFAVEQSQTIRIGNVDTDAMDDFFTFLQPYAQCYSVRSLGTSMGSNVLWPEAVAPLSTDVPWVGDANGDGKADIIIFAQGEGKVYVSLGT